MIRLWMRQDQTHDEAIIGKPDDLAFEVSELVELRDDPLADRSGDGPDQLHLMAGYVAGAAGEFAPFSAAISPARKRIAPRDAGVRSCDVPPVDNDDVVWIDCRSRHDGFRSVTSGFDDIKKPT
jgi:hypothetical protein